MGRPARRFSGQALTVERGRGPDILLCETLSDGAQRPASGIAWNCDGGRKSGRDSQSGVEMGEFTDMPLSEDLPLSIDQ